VLRGLLRLLRHAPLVVKVLALLVCMPLVLAAPRQVEVCAPALVQRDEQVRAEVSVPNVNLCPRQLFLQKQPCAERLLNTKLEGHIPMAGASRCTAQNRR